MLAPATRIDSVKCNGCGLCVKVCPSRTLSLKEGKAAVTGDSSLHCGHCVAICPTGAVTVTTLTQEAIELASVKVPAAWQPYGRFDAAGLIQLMHSRRSSRMFLLRPVPLQTLRDLVKIGTLAPSGTNSQKWTFHILPDRPAVEALGRRVAAFFERLNRLAESRLARGLARIFLKDALGRYYREYYAAVKEGLDEFRRLGRDRLFHGAPAVILIGSLPGASCPQEDALLAAGYITLAAHALGYGSCLIGFVVEAIRNDPSIGRALKLQPGEKIHAALALGRSREWYKRFPGRLPLSPRIIGAEEIEPTS